MEWWFWQWHEWVVLGGDSDCHEWNEMADWLIDWKVYLISVAQLVKYYFRWPSAMNWVGILTVIWMEWDFMNHIYKWFVLDPQPNWKPTVVAVISLSEHTHNDLIRIHVCQLSALVNNYVHKLLPLYGYWTPLITRKPFTIFWREYLYTKEYISTPLSWTCLVQLYKECLLFKTMKRSLMTNFLCLHQRTAFTLLVLVIYLEHGESKWIKVHRLVMVGGHLGEVVSGVVWMNHVGK